MANRAWWAALATVVGVSSARGAEPAQGSSPLGDDRTLVALAVALACADAPDASAPAATAAASTAPGLELVATVRAKALEFDVVPTAQVLFRGGGTRGIVWKAERVNLPAHPEPGVVYRDVVLRLTVTGDIDALAALLREAKRASAGIAMEPGPASSAAPSSPPAAAPAAAAAPHAP